MSYLVRKLQTHHLMDANTIINENKHYLKSMGINQWQQGYPSLQDLEKDISNSNLYGIFDNEDLMGIFVLLFEPDPNYEVIWDGAWSEKSPYSVVHRIAVGSAYKGKGISKDIFNFVFETTKNRGYSQVRVDTHPDNKVMQNLLIKMGFSKCGKINVSDGLRYAFEKKL